jgi:hypothetical protein
MKLISEDHHLCELFMGCTLVSAPRSKGGNVA